MEYTKDFFRRHEISAGVAAKEVVPYLYNVVKPKSVVDVGCGLGDWLVEFRRLGVTEILGIDGSWVEKRMLKIPEDEFLTWDLEKPLRLKRKFDLVMCLEVAEHLSGNAAAILIHSLCNLAPVVVFSAAIPNQGGVGHVNEQWLDYWVELFKNKGYVMVDYLRPLLWNGKKIEWWYRQNMVFFVKREKLKNYLKLFNTYKNQNWSVRLVHPECYEHVVNNYMMLAMPINRTLFEVIRAVPVLFINEMKKLGKIILKLRE